MDGILTRRPGEPLGLVLPIDEDEIDGDAGQDDGYAHPHFHGRNVDGQRDQERADDEEDEWQNDADLHDDTRVSATEWQITIGIVSKAWRCLG